MTFVKNFLYIDIETTGYDKKKDRITMVSFAPFFIRDGIIEEKGLTQLKEWIHPNKEKGIIRDFLNQTHLDWTWYDVPVGFNLPFDIDFIIQKAKQYNIHCKFSFQDIFDRKPGIDLRGIGVLMFKGKFLGSGLDAITRKQGNGNDARIMYSIQEYDKLCKYNQQEYQEFMRLLQFLLKKMPELKQKFLEST